jgi:superfamily II DNA or RNA helicase
VAELFASRHRIGASADERRKDGKDWLIRDTFGPVVYEIGKGDLQDREYLVPVHMRVVTTEYVDGVYLDSVAEPGVAADWNGMVTRMNQDDARNDLIEAEVLLALRDPWAKVLLLNDRVEACRGWAHRISMRIGADKCGLLLGKARKRGSRRTNERTLAGLRGGVVRFVAGTSVADEGLDVPPLTHVFVTCPSHTHLQRLEQRAGRTARPFAAVDGTKVLWKKEHGTVVYFWDYMMFPYVDGVDVLRRHGMNKEAENRLRSRRARFVDRFFKAADEVEVVSGRRVHGHQEA